MLAGAALFGVLVTANSAGYRYGASDQAFYIPAISRAIRPALFPRDAPLIDAQARLTVFDELMAGVSVSTGIELPGLFFGGYLLTILLFTAGVLLIGRCLYRSTWTVVALGLALTLRHRIAGTGVNTFEGYFHPRVMAFAIGMIAVGSFLHGRRLIACTLTVAALAWHPTTGLWFAVWMGVALATSSGTTLRWRPAVAVGVCVAALWLLLSGPVPGRVTVMDSAWTAAFSDKDYLFPTDDWTLGIWLSNAIAPIVLWGIYSVRRRARMVSAPERGLFLGSVTLLALFAGSLPFIEGRVALAVQLQTSRVLWLIELMATAYLVWALGEGPFARAHASRVRVLVAALALFSAARGAYVLRVEHDRPLIALDLPATEWRATTDWIARNTALDAHFLVDPWHAIAYGLSLRVAAERDVFLERAKDTAMAAYSRDVALRVSGRLREIDDFASVNEERALALARVHDLDYLIADRPFALPLVHANGQFRVYSLKSTLTVPEKQGK